jgi:hypothetical protein
LKYFTFLLIKLITLFSWQLQNSFGKLGIGGKLKEKEKKEEPKVREIYCTGYRYTILDKVSYCTVGLVMGSGWVRGGHMQAG